MRTTRWINPTLPQTLQYAVILLYFDAALAMLSVLGLRIGGSAYYFVAWFLPNNTGELNHFTGLLSLIVLAAAGVYIFAGWAIANEQKRGWLAGAIVSGGAVMLPLVTYGPGIIATGYVISYLFDIALFVLLVHPRSRKYQHIWFH